MDRGGGGRLRRRKSLHQRLGLKSMVCCGSTWGFGTSAMSEQAENDNDNDNENDNNNDDDNYNENEVVESTHLQINVNDIPNSGPDCTVPTPRMNLAAALAAERQLRSTSGTGDGVQSPLNNDVFMMSTEVGTPLRISLMRLLEETETEMDGQDEVDEEKEGMGRDQMCCVCMGRKKGAALIPCGHTFCRVCCRELWLNRGSCPLCNRSILEILDIY